MDILSEIKNVFDVEMNALVNVKNSLSNSIIDVVNVVNDCKGKVVLCGMGKPGHIAKKISATMSSLGIQSYTLHPAEAMHGDLGTLSGDDVIIFISNSGETAEICHILPNIKMIGATMAAITSHPESTLAKYSDFVIELPIMLEASVHNLAPTSSTTAALVIGDAIAVVVSKMRKFKKENFALFHPAGTLGRKLTTTVYDVMAKEAEVPVVRVDSTILQAIEEMCEKPMGAVIITDDDNNMCGLITEGDLRRSYERKIDVYNTLVNDVMTKTPVYTRPDVLAVEALKIMERGKHSLSVLPVLDNDNTVCGLISNHSIIRLGIFI